MWNKTTLLQVLVILLVVVAYFAVLSRNLHESERRSLQLKSETLKPNHVFVSIRIVNVDTSAGEMTARIHLQLAGSIAKDEVTPTVDLKLLLNSFRGTQEVAFPKGTRLSPIEAVFALDGNVSKYPFDSYESNLWMLITTPSRTRQAQAQPDNDEQEKKEPENGFGQLMVGTAALQRSEPVPIQLDLSASVPRIKFQGNIAENPSQGVEGIALRLTRADNVIMLSLFVMVLMMSLAMSVLFMAARVLTSDSSHDMLPLSLGITLIFGLPALRNVQPGVPPVGVMGDYLSFLWAENIVGVSAVMVMFTWLRRPRQPKVQKGERPGCQ
jgi:hypothetical protein